jgi:hypothetical protein
VRGRINGNRLMFLKQSRKQVGADKRRGFRGQSPRFCRRLTAGLKPRPSSSTTSEMAFSEAAGAVAGGRSRTQASLTSLRRWQQHRARSENL